MRADENVPGHGIGLAMVHDTVELYGGTLDASTPRALGGARFSLRLPGASSAVRRVLDLELDALRQRQRRGSS